MEYEDLQDAYQNLEQKMRSLQKLERIKPVVYVTPVVAAGIIIGGLALASEKQESPDKDFKPNLTDYQERYVECPHEHIYICTKMSRLEAEPVKYLDSEDGRIYLRYSETDRLVARTPQNGTTGYLIDIERNSFSEDTGANASERGRPNAG